MSDLKFSLAVLQRVSDFLADLPEEHVADIAEGRCLLTFIPAGTTQPRVPGSRSRTTGPATKVDVHEAREALATLNDREAGRVYLAPMRAKPDLQALAKLLGMGGVSSLAKTDLIEAIVERTIGNRLNSAAIRQL